MINKVNIERKRLNMQRLKIAVKPGSHDAQASFVEDSFNHANDPVARLYLLPNGSLIADGFGVVASLNAGLDLDEDCFETLDIQLCEDSERIPGYTSGSVSPNASHYKAAWESLSAFLNRIRELNIKFLHSDEADDKKVKMAKLCLHGLETGKNVGGKGHFKFSTDDLKGSSNDEISVNLPSWEILAVPEDVGNVTFDTDTPADDVQKYVKEKIGSAELDKWFQNVNWSKVVKLATIDDFVEDEKKIALMNRSQKKEHELKRFLRQRVIPSEQEIRYRGYQWAFNASNGSDQIAAGVIVFGMGRLHTAKHASENRAASIPVYLSWKSVSPEHVTSLTLQDYTVRDCRIEDLPLPFLSWALLVTNESVHPDASDARRLRSQFANEMKRKWMLSKTPKKALYIEQYVELRGNEHNEKLRSDYEEALKSKKKSITELPVQLKEPLADPESWLDVLKKVDWHKALQMYQNTSYGATFTALRPTSSSMKFIVFTPDPVQVNLVSPTAKAEDAKVEDVSLSLIGKPWIINFFRFAANTTDPKFNPRDYVELLTIDDRSYSWEKDVDLKAHFEAAKKDKAISQSSAQLSRFTR